MGFEQFNNMLTVAAALSMAGWVARTPEYIPDNHPFEGDNRDELDYFGQQQQFWQNNNNDQMLAPLVQAMPANYDINEHFHESKFISSFTPLSEMQELLSWEEAYRRGDLSFGSTTNYVYPSTYEGNNEHLFSNLQTPYNYDAENDNLMSRLPSYYDDGYGSGDTNLGSPESSDLSSLLSLNLDDISTSGSPQDPNLLNLNDNVISDDLNNELSVEPHSSVNGVDVAGAVGFSNTDPDFDIERLLSDDYYDLYDAFPRTKDEPPDTARSRVSNLDYASPLIDPNFDEYLGRFIGPDQQNNLDTSFDDPFRMEFSDNVIPDGKFVSDVLADFDAHLYGTNLDGGFPTPYEKTLESEGDEEETESVIQGASQSSYSGPSTENIHSPKSNVHLSDHDYAKLVKEEELMDADTRKAVDALASNFYKYHKDSLDEKPQTQLTRTYAPASRRSTTSTRRKTATYVFPDFPYTQEELIDMDVDTFNVVVSKLDEIRQLVLRDLRKKGKNKYAARNCRKRKLEVIDNLDNNVELLEKQKELLLEEQKMLLEETRQIHEKTVWLNNYILERLFDENGNSYADSDYTLEYTTDGNVYLVPYVVKKEGTA